jgi:hypothetical protein
MGEEVIQDEEDIEQQGSCQGGGLLDDGSEGGEGESWQGMPQVKGLKELKLPVGNEIAGGYDVTAFGLASYPFFCDRRSKSSPTLEEEGRHAENHHRSGGLLI